MGFQTIVLFSTVLILFSLQDAQTSEYPNPCDSVATKGPIKSPWDTCNECGCMNGVISICTRIGCPDGPKQAGELCDTFTNNCAKGHSCVNIGPPNKEIGVCEIMGKTNTQAELDFEDLSTSPTTSTNNSAHGNESLDISVNDYLDDYP